MSFCIPCFFFHWLDLTQQRLSNQKGLQAELGYFVKAEVLQLKCDIDGVQWIALCIRGEF